MEKELIIKFSHEYTKLGIIPDKAKLLECFVKQSEELSEDFINYDTCYLSPDENRFQNYQLPEAKPVIILLFLIENTFNPKTFTTVRPYNFFKYKYYSELRGKEFKIQIIK